MPITLTLAGLAGAILLSVPVGAIQVFKGNLQSADKILLALAQPDPRVVIFFIWFVRALWIT